MSTEVDISNAALGYLGDDAVVSSISPPDGSAQAEHCSRFYPMARNTMLEAHTWQFATRRATLAAASTSPPSSWLYAYAPPSDALSLIAIIAPDAIDDYSTSIPLPSPVSSSFFDPSTTPPQIGVYVPQPYVAEIDANGNDVIYTNQPSAVLRYTVLVTDPTKFSPLFTEALTWLLASKVAGPLLKGAEGRAAAQECLKAYVLWFGKAAASDANQRNVNPTQNVAWMTGR